MAKDIKASKKAGRSATAAAAAKSEKEMKEEEQETAKEEVMETRQLHDSLSTASKDAVSKSVSPRLPPTLPDVSPDTGSPHASASTPIAAIVGAVVGLGLKGAATSFPPPSLLPTLTGPPLPEIPTFPGPPLSEMTAGASPSSASSPIAAIVGSVVGLGLIGPGTVFGVMAIFFKPALRRTLLRCGLKRLADLFVPDLQGDVRLMSAKMKQLEGVLAEVKGEPSTSEVCQFRDS